MTYNTHQRPTRPPTAVRPSRQRPTCMCKAYPIDVYPGGKQRRGAQCPHSNSCSIPCGSLDTSVPFQHHLFLNFAFADDTRRTPKDYTACGDLQVAASCKLPGIRVHRLQQEGSCRYRDGCLLVMLQGELVVGDGTSVFVHVCGWASGSLGRDS